MLNFIEFVIKNFLNQQMTYGKGYLMYLFPSQTEKERLTDYGSCHGLGLINESRAHDLLLYFYYDDREYKVYDKTSEASIKILREKPFSKFFHSIIN